MARIAGVDLPNDNRVDIALTYIYGIGRVLSGSVLEKAQIDPARRVHSLSDEEVNKIAKILEKGFLIEGDLRQRISGNIKRLREISAYRGSRHARNLPSRSNARTRRGKRQTIGAMKKQDRVKLEKTPAAPAQK